MDRPALGVGSAPGGCWRTALALPALILLAPAAAALRTVARWRRGAEARVEVRTTSGGREVAVDLPAGFDRPRLLTEFVARIAGRLATPGLTYALAHTDRATGESVATPFGASVQALADRFHRAGRQYDLEGCTVWWFALPRGVHLGEVLDPETGGARLCRAGSQATGCHWWLASVRETGVASCRWRLEFCGGDALPAAVDDAVAWLREALKSRG